VVLRKKTKYYPIYLINTEIFKRTGIIDTRLFLNESGLIAIIRSVVRKYFESNEYEKIKSVIDLSIIKEFAKTNNINITDYFINYANLCYAVILQYGKNKCYLPIAVSHYSLEKDIELIFEPYSSVHETHYENLDKLAKLYNKWVKTKSEAEGLGNILVYPTIEVSNWLVIRNTGKVIGFVHNLIYYYCASMTEATAKKYASVPIQYILYEPSMINKLIYNIKTGKKKLERNTELDNKLQHAMYDYYLYNLIILQFISIFNKQRNIPLRRKIITTLAKTNFDKNIDPIRELISSIKDIEDASKLKNILARFITVHHDKKLLLDDIHTTYFNFDRIELEKLKTTNYDKVLSELHRLSKKFVKFGDITKQKNFHFPNILVSCDEINKGEFVDYCSGNKFIIKKDKLDDILNILAYDVINPTKWKWLFNSIFIQKSVDFFKFIKRPNETITVEFPQV